MAAARRVATSATGALVVAHTGTDGMLRATLKNLSGTATVTLGGTAAEAMGAESWPWEPLDGAIELQLQPGESWWAASAIDQTIAVLIEGGR